MKKNLFIGIALLLSAITSCTKDEMKEVVEANTVTTKAEITDIMTIETDTVGQSARIGFHRHEACHHQRRG